ncbi:LPXTG cell wall anchor domain-containing protein [Streptococcus danieliae]
MKTLPNTGTAASGLGLMGLVSGLFGLGTVGKRKKDSE